MSWDLALVKKNIKKIFSFEKNGKIKLRKTKPKLCVCVSVSVNVHAKASVGDYKELFEYGTCMVWVMNYNVILGIYLFYKYPALKLKY